MPADAGEAELAKRRRTNKGCRESLQKLAALVE
jgi:hypothetical protein